LREKLTEMAAKLNKLRSFEREARLKGDRQKQERMRKEALALEDDMRLLTEKVKNETLRRVLMLRYVDGLAPCRIQYVLGLSRGQYYRLLERA